MEVANPEIGPEPGRRATVWAMAGIIATVSVFAVAQGLTYPLLSLILARQGTSSALIGLSAAMTPLGFVASAPLIPMLARRFGPGRTALCCAGLAAAILGLIGLTQELGPWFPLRFLLGAAANPLYVLSEVWLIAIAPAKQRGRIVGIYTSVISAGFAAGPLSLILVGSHGWPPFAVGIGAFLACAACLAAVLPRLPTIDDGKTDASVRSFAPHAWMLLFAVVVAAAFEQAMLALLPVYGGAYELGAGAVSALLAVLIAGNIALQVPLGFFAERFSARTALVACALGTAIGCGLLPTLLGSPLIWPMVFVWGALSWGIYTMALVELGDRFSGSMLVAGNAAFAMMWGVGGIAGPPVIGALMDVAGAQALPALLGVLCLALAGTASRRR